MDDFVIYVPRLRDKGLGAILGFFAVLATVTAESTLGQALRSRVRDKFSPIQAPVANF